MTDENILPSAVSLPKIKEIPIQSPDPIHSPAPLDDDILGGVIPTPAKSHSKPTNEDLYKSLFDDFIALKTKCGENTAKVTFDKFTTKLMKNREALMSKHNCKEVSFRVYEKDGRAALKASPVF